MLEIIIVVVIVAIVAFMSGRSFYRTMTGKNEGCSCVDNCQGCSYKDSLETDKEQDAEI